MTGCFALSQPTLEQAASIMCAFEMVVEFSEDSTAGLLS